MSGDEKYAAQSGAEQLAEHVDSIYRAINGKVEKERLTAELQRYLNEFKVPLNEAKRSIIRKYGGAFRPGDVAGADKTLTEIDVGDSSVNLLCRVLSATPKEVTARGEQKTIFYGLLGDQTAAVPFTAWKDFNLKKGDVVRIQNAYVTEWQERPQVNLGDRAMIKRESDDVLSPDVIARFSQKTKIRDIKENMGGVEVIAKILSIETRTINVSGESKEILSGVLADETGKTQFTAWHTFDIKKNDVLRIAGAYVKSWKGIPSINFDERSTIERLTPDALPSVVEEANDRVEIRALEKAGGALDTQLQGFVIEIRPGSGLVFRCPQCRRVVQKNLCAIHGKVVGVPDVRIKAVIDDGTGTMNAVFGREITEKLLGKTLDELMAAAKDAMDTNIITQEIQEILLMQPVRTRGSVMSDNFGLMLIGKELEFAQRDIATEVEQLFGELERVEETTTEERAPENEGGD